MNRETASGKDANQSRAHPYQNISELSGSPVAVQPEWGFGESLRFAARMALREVRASSGKFGLAALLMTVAAATAFGLRSITAGITGHAFENARSWIAADAMALYFGPQPAAEQWTAVKNLGAGIESTLVAEMPIMLASDQAPDPVVAEVKVVDPSAYPYYGNVELASGRLFRKALEGDAMVVSADLLRTLHVNVGDPVRVNETEFHIRDVIAAEPDRFVTPPVPIGRVIVSQKAFDRTNLTDFGPLGFYRVLLRIPPNADRRTLCSRLEEIFPSARVIDYTSRTPESVTVEGWVIPFMNMVGLLALVLGAVGFGAAAHFHLLRSTHALAILKCLGATTYRIAGIYMLQVMCLAFLAVLAGIAGGSLIELWGAKIAVRYFGTPVQAAGRMSAAAQTAIFSLSIAAAVAWIPLSRIRRVSASALLRRDTGEKYQPPRSKPKPGVGKLICLFAILAAAAFLIFHFAATRRAQVYALFGSAAAVCSVYFVAGLAISAVLGTSRACGRRMPWAVRQGTQNLHRYRRQSRTAITVLASSVAFIVIALAGEWRLRSYILDTIPFHSPNLLFLYLDSTRRAELSSALAQQSGLEGPPQFVPAAWVSLVRTGDATLEALRASKPEMWIQRDWPVSCSGEKPRYIDVVSGQWWRADSREPEAALTKDVADLLGVTLGSRLDFLAGRRLTSARVTALLRIPAAQRAWWREIILNCQSLPNALYSGAVTIAPEHLSEVRKYLRRRFPDLLFLDLNDLLMRTEGIGHEMLSVLAIVGGLATCMALIVLLALIRAMRDFRIYEIALLRALGARRQLLLAALVMEYLALGGLSGFFGAVLGFAGISLVLRLAAGISEWVFDPSAMLAAIASAGLLVAVVGVLGSITLLRPKPVELLRRH